MLYPNLYSSAPLLVLLHVSNASPQLASPKPSSPIIKNANHIFNAIHSSMRQWGSSLNHNGVSFFPAYVPAGTELYHGTGTPDAVQVMEWLAFEPEHALQFAWIISFGNDTKQRSDLSPKWAYGSDLASILTQQTTIHEGVDVGLQASDGSQHPLHSYERLLSQGKRPRGPITEEPGWLHTYVTKHDLHLLYIDGQSAAKSRKGTLDSQDYLLGAAPPETWLDRERALHMCGLAAGEWRGQIDGFIRMEHGFELILCDFPTHVDLMRVERSDKDLDDIMDNIEMERFAFWKAITARYHGIGMDRVRLDYSRMVTAFAYDIGLFDDGLDLPRLRNVSKGDRKEIFTDLSESILHDDYDRPYSQQINWQAVADMIVARYSDVLQELAYGPSYGSMKRIKQATELLMQPFIDASFRNAALEHERCASHFIPSSHAPSIASIAVVSISQKICSTIVAASTQSLRDAKRSFQDLVEFLRWTSWKECRGCQYDEICFTAIWPAGNFEDHVRPGCKNASEITERHGYWGMEDV